VATISQRDRSVLRRFEVFCAIEGITSATALGDPAVVEAFSPLAARASPLILAAPIVRRFDELPTSSRSMNSPPRSPPRAPLAPTTRTTWRPFLQWSLISRVARGSTTPRCCSGSWWARGFVLVKLPSYAEVTSAATRRRARSRARSSPESGAPSSPLRRRPLARRLVTT
jgi:hypothetical protein